MASTSTFGWPTPDNSDPVRDGAFAIRTLGDAVDATLAGGFRLAGTRYFTSSGVFEKANPLLTGDINVRAIRVRACGGGGGGAGSPATTAGQVHAGCSGSGSAYAESFITNIAGLGTSETVTVGLGGAGGVGAANGADGQASAFGSLLEARGGLGGFSQGVITATGGYPGVSGQTIGTGDLVLSGSPSTVGIASPGAFILSGIGGSSVIGGGASGVERFGSTGANGINGGAFGGGGSGSVQGPSQGTPKDGGTGANGIVIVDVYV